MRKNVVDVLRQLPLGDERILEASGKCLVVKAEEYVAAMPSDTLPFELVAKSGLRLKTLLLLLQGTPTERTYEVKGEQLLIRGKREKYDLPLFKCEEDPGIDYGSLLKSLTWYDLDDNVLKALIKARTFCSPFSVNFLGVLVGSDVICASDNYQIYRTTFGLESEGKIVLPVPVCDILDACKVYEIKYAVRKDHLYLLVDELLLSFPLLSAKFPDTANLLTKQEGDIPVRFPKGMQEQIEKVQKLSGDSAIVVSLDMVKGTLVLSASSPAGKFVEHIASLDMEDGHLSRVQADHLLVALASGTVCFLNPSRLLSLSKTEAYTCICRPAEQVEAE